MRRPENCQSQPLGPATGDLGRPLVLTVELSAGHCARPGPREELGRDRWDRGPRGTYIQNVHALSEAEVEGVELRGQVLCYLSQTHERPLWTPPRGRAPTQTPTGWRDGDSQQHLGQLHTHLCAGVGVPQALRPWAPAALHLPIPATGLLSRHTPLPDVPAPLTSRAAAGFLTTNASRARRAASQRSQSSDEVRAAQNTHGPALVPSPDLAEAEPAARVWTLGRGSRVPGHAGFPRLSHPRAGA